MASVSGGVRFHVLKANIIKWQIIALHFAFVRRKSLDAYNCFFFWATVISCR